MSNEWLDAILEIRQTVYIDREAMISTGLTSLTPAVTLMGDHLEFIDKKLTELTTKKEEN